MGDRLRHPDRRLRQVEPQRGPVDGAAGGLACALAVAASDVEHMIVRPDPGGFHERLLQVPDRCVVELGVRGPLLPLVTVPGGVLLLVASSPRIAKEVVVRAGVWSTLDT